MEIVASLVLLADRRAGRKSGWLPWAALTIGTAASLAANIATADHGTISRVIAGWPATALLIAVKLLSGILEHRHCPSTADRPPAARSGTCHGQLASRPRQHPADRATHVHDLVRPGAPRETHSSPKDIRSPATPWPATCAPPVTASATTVSHLLGALRDTSAA